MCCLSLLVLFSSCLYFLSSPSLLFLCLPLSLTLSVSLSLNLSSSCPKASASVIVLQVSSVVPPKGAVACEVRPDWCLLGSACCCSFGLLPPRTLAELNTEGQARDDIIDDMWKHGIVKTSGQTCLPWSLRDGGQKGKKGDARKEGSKKGGRKAENKEGRTHLRNVGWLFVTIYDNIDRPFPLYFILIGPGPLRN